MFNKTLINKPVTSSIKEAALSSSLRTVIIFVRTIESFMFHGAMAFRADQRELHSSCSASHSAFASARLMALRRLVAGRALDFEEELCMHMHKCITRESRIQAIHAQWLCE